MAKKKSEPRVTKSEFLRKALARKPDLDLDQINRRWQKAGHPGQISGALFYKVRRDLGIRTECGSGLADRTVQDRNGTVIERMNKCDWRLNPGKSKFAQWQRFQERGRKAEGMNG